MESRVKQAPDRNPDPITGAPGSHPVGSGMGAASHRPEQESGWELRPWVRDLQFEEVEPELKAEWSSPTSQSNTGWERAKEAARHAWGRVDRADHDE